MSTQTAARFTVSGPGIDTSYADPGPAISRAITAAERHEGEATFYVRADDGSVVGRVDKKENGDSSIYRFGKAVA